VKTDLIKVRSGFDNEKCYVHGRIGQRADGSFVITAQKLLLKGSDLFDGLEEAHSPDGIVWSDMKVIDGFVPYPVEDAPTVFESVCDFTSFLHRSTGKLLGTGAVICYDTAFSPKRIVHGRLGTAYSVFDEEAGCFEKWRKLDVPDDYFLRSRAGSTQRFDNADGSILLPVYFLPPDAAHSYSSVIFKCAFDGQNLRITDIGSPVSGESDHRGLYEPSVSRFPVSGKYVMTLRSDLSGWYALSDDGLNFDKAEEWRFDNGELLGNYNTQQHFARLGDKLYLVYTRRGLNNDHVFRHRAPLLMGEIDPDRMCIIRDTETVLVPERGARLGNFSVAQLSDTCCLLTASEWMQPVGCEKYGSANAIWVTYLSK